MGFVQQPAWAIRGDALVRCRIWGDHLKAAGQAGHHVQSSRNSSRHQPAGVLDVLVPRDVEVADIDVGARQAEATK
ncbi:hypothetical protein [Mycobacterium sp.]|jgi:hypothetical protein|uniref:hypothetical protein n=1 Tax=Mycobacterium sp. TaxID=1785 RepID=UPI002602E6EF|nr:hypothetical protein [Mycobacterium sp.]